MWTKQILAAILFGIVSVIVGYIISWITHGIAGVDVPADCKDWNKHHVMELTLMLTGITTYYLYVMSAQYL